jgi:hypothetical protein
MAVDPARTTEADRGARCDSEIREQPAALLRLLEHADEYDAAARAGPARAGRRPPRRQGLTKITLAQ